MALLDARSVANSLLARAEVDGEELDQLRLQKLVCLAHGWHLGLCDRPLMSQLVHAWPYGPVVPEVYHAFKQFRDRPIRGRAKFYSAGSGWSDFPTAMDPYSKDVIDAVWQKYRGMTVGQLITLTHEPGTPWATVTAGLAPADIRDIPIPNDVTAAYYRKLAEANRAAREASSRVA